MEALFPAIISLSIVKVCSMVNLATVGQYQEAKGRAPLAEVAFLWSVVYGIGLWGIDGSVPYSEAKGKGCDKQERNRFFTTALIITLALLLAFCGVFVFFIAQILTFFGANENLIPLCEQHVLPILFALPVFGTNQFLGAFLGKDDNPNLAMGAALGGGTFNVVGNYVFVFNLGVFGAGLATAIESVTTLLIKAVLYTKTLPYVGREKTETDFIAPSF